MRGDVIVERLPGETLVYDQASDTAHCLSDAAATVFELSDGARTRPALATLASERLGRRVDEAELDAVLVELRSKALLADEPDTDGYSRRQVMVAGGATAAAALITTIVAPLPAAAQSATPPSGGTPPGGSTGGPGDPCPPDCDEGLECQGEPSRCCVPTEGACTEDSDCCDGFCGADIEGSPAVCFPGEPPR